MRWVSLAVQAALAASLAGFLARETLSAPVESETAIPHRIAPIFGENGENYLVRLEAIRQLGRNLSDEETDALYDFLHREAGEDALSADKLNALKNEVVNVLKRQRRHPGKLIRHLVELYRDKAQHPVWRDYCIQHLGTLFAAAQGEQKEAVTDILWSATDEKKSGMAGTALIALTNNRDDLALDAQQIADKALAIAQDGTYSPAARMTAIQICAKLEDRRILPVARAIAQGSGSVALRASAIGAIGLVGGGSDVERIRRYARSSDIRLRTAAGVALERLEKKRW